MSRTKTKAALDWDKVELAMARCKRGQAQDGDTALVQRAFTEAPQEYIRRKKLVDSQVISEEKEKWR